TPTPAERTAAAVPPADLRLDGAAQAAAVLPRIRSLREPVGGDLGQEPDLHGASAQRPANRKAGSQSIDGVLRGIPIDRGALAGVEPPIGRYLPEAAAIDPANGAITIEDLLTMRSGLETTSNRNYGRWVLSGN